MSAGFNLPIPPEPGLDAVVQASAEKLGLMQVPSLEVGAADEFASAFAELTRERADGLLLEPNSLNLARSE